MRALVFPWSSILLLFPIGASAAIFGADDRIAITDSFPKLALARATAIAVLRTIPDDVSPGIRKIAVDPLSAQVCQDERFAGDPSIPYSCTGFLVAPDLIVTAGHCMVNRGESHHETDTYCQTYQWLFDYRDKARPGSLDLSAIPSANFYRCKEVVYAVTDEGAPFRDYALVKLDRPVLDRAPLKIARNPVRTAEPVTMIGYPFGTPAKYSGNAKVLLDNPKRLSFITNLNAFEGNSGSPVFNGDNEVVGILIGGTPTESFVQDASGTCGRYNRCRLDGTGCQVPDPDTSLFPEFQRTGSEVERIGIIQELIRKSGSPGF